MAKYYGGTIARFADAAARDAAITTPVEGMFAYHLDNDSLMYYDGAAWVAVGGGGAAAPAGPNVTVSAVAGETATAPGTTVVPAPSAGNVFINTADGATWMYDGTAWQQTTTRHPMTYFGTAGTGAPTAPPVGGVGDLYLDTSVASGAAAIYEANAAGTGWEAAPSITLQTGDQFFDIANNDVHREV